MGSFSKKSLRLLCSAVREHAEPALNKAKMMKAEETPASARINGGDISKVFWMKDPKTGNWMPENHLEDTDVADLRKKLLSKIIKI